MQITEQRQQAETAAVRLQARLAADSNLLLAAKLPRSEGAEEAAAEAAQQQQQQAPAAGVAQMQQASGSNPFFATPWGDVQADDQQLQQAAAGGAPTAVAVQADGQPAASQLGPPGESSRGVAAGVQRSALGWGIASVHLPSSERFAQF